MSEPMEEYHLDTQRVHEFVRTVEETADAHDEISALLDALREPFAALLEEDGWLPERYMNLPPADYDDKGQMGDDIAQWLLYRKEGKLSLSSLVVPPGIETPVHDHLAWGLVGLHQGTQEETFYHRVDDGTNDVGQAQLERAEVQYLGVGDFYELIPPEGDIHKVHTTSDEPSVSIHLLGADIGCIPRHAFEPDADFIREFQSGYTNVECETPAFGADGHGHDHGHSH